MFDLYYYLPWPECQKVESIDGFGDNSIFDAFNYGYFVKKEWYDKLK